MPQTLLATRPISGHGADPKPTSIPLASRCTASLAEVDALLCLAAKEVFSGVHPGTAQLIAARDEVRVAFEAARCTAPRSSET